MANEIPEALEKGKKTATKASAKKDGTNSYMLPNMPT